MTNLTISPLKLNTVAAAQGIKAQPQNQAKVETNNNNADKANDKKTDLHATSEAIKAAQDTQVDSKTKKAVDDQLKAILADERGLVRVAVMGKKNQTCTVGSVEMKISQIYDEKSQKMTINISAKGYNRTEVKDMKSLQNEIKAEKDEDHRDKNTPDHSIPQNPDGTYTIIGPNGEKVNIRLPGSRYGR